MSVFNLRGVGFTRNMDGTVSIKILGQPCGPSTNVIELSAYEWNDVVQKLSDVKSASVSRPEHTIIDVYIQGIGTVRECIGCRALISGGPTKCKRCAITGVPKPKKKHFPPQDPEPTVKIKKNPKSNKRSNRL